MVTCAGSLPFDGIRSRLRVDWRPIVLAFVILGKTLSLMLNTELFCVSPCIFGFGLPLCGFQIELRQIKTSCQTPTHQTIFPYCPLHSGQTEAKIRLRNIRPIYLHQWNLCQHIILCGFFVSKGVRQPQNRSKFKTGSFLTSIMNDGTHQVKIKHTPDLSR